MILLFKLATTPILIALLTFVSRRFGPVAGGLLMGVPLVTGPISIFAAIENGTAFAQQAAITNLVGQVSTCLFCFSYATLAPRMNCWLAAFLSVATFVLVTILWSLFHWSALGALLLLLAAIVVFTLLQSSTESAVRITNPTRFDIPLRMVVSTGFVVLMSALGTRLGPQLSGLVAPFPVFVLVMSVFTHRMAGAQAAGKLAHGVIIGSFSFAAFFTIVANTFAALGVVLTYLSAVFACIMVSGVVYVIMQKKVLRGP